MSRRLFAFIWLTAVVVLSAFAPGIPVFAVGANPAETRVVAEMNGYALSATLSGEWKVTLDRASHRIYLDQATHLGTPRASSRGIQVVELDTSKIWAVPHSEQWMANDFRRGEEADMIARGVMTGIYQLEDLEKSEADAHGKHLYTMKYRQVFPTHIGHGYLYLYFPLDIGKTRKFYAFQYFDLQPKEHPRDVTLGDFYAVVAGFVLKSP